eukprot:116289-Pyramimonas_sp.AAC.1
MLEEVRTISLERGRLGQKSSPLAQPEFKALRSLIYELNWVGRGSRPEAAGAASVLASRLKGATTGD